MELRIAPHERDCEGASEEVVIAAWSIKRKWGARLVSSLSRAKCATEAKRR
ncbi:MAG: hypothetical protein ACTS6A_01275 [Candidatus Hodgkinia cicadicola]